MLLITQYVESVRVRAEVHRLYYCEFFLQKTKKCIYCIILSMFFFVYIIYNNKYSQKCKWLWCKKQNNAR